MYWPRPSKEIVDQSCIESTGGGNPYSIQNSAAPHAGHHEGIVTNTEELLHIALIIGK
jgi:hypothetical protein